MFYATQSVELQRRLAEFDSSLKPFSSPEEAQKWAKENPGKATQWQARDPEGMAHWTGQATAGQVADAMERKISGKMPEMLTPDQQKSARVKEIISKGNPYRDGNFSLAVELETLNKTVAQQLKEEVTGKPKPHNLTETEVAAFQRHGYSVPGVDQGRLDSLSRGGNY